MPVEPVIQQSYLVWFLRTLGPGGLFVGLTGLVAFGLTLLVVFRGKGPSTGAALAFIVPMPVLLSVFCVLKGMLASFSVIAVSDTQLKASEVAAGIAETLSLPLFGMLSMAPSYLLAMLFLLGRSIQADASGKASSEP